MEPIKLKEIDSCGELQEILRARRGKLIGNPSAANHCYLLELPEGVAKVTLGLAALTHGIAPTVVLDRRTSTLIVVHGSEAARVRTDDGAVIYSKQLTVPIRGLLRLEEDGSVVILHELGLVKLSGNGEVAWERCTNLIEGHAVDGDVVTLNIEGGVQRRYSLASGRPV